MRDESHGASAIQPHRLCGTSIHQLHGAVHLILHALFLSSVLLFSFQAAPHTSTSDLLERYAGLRLVMRLHPSPAADRHQLDTQQEYLLTAVQYCVTDYVRQSCRWSAVIVLLCA